MDIPLEKVKELRNKTGAGMMDVKRALEESNGDFEKAIEYLRKKGSLTSQKRIEKIAKEGLIAAKTTSDRKNAVILEVNCETDFVARSSAFQQFTNSLADTLIRNAGPLSGRDNGDMNNLLTLKMQDGLTVKQAFDDLVGQVGEKVEIKRVKPFSSADGFFCEYNHVGNKLASLVEITGSISDLGVKLGNELAMQVAAMKPAALDRSGIDAEVIEKEKEIYLTQAKNENKPANIAEKIVSNKVEKFYEENCLLEQEYIKEPGKSVSDYIAEVSKQAGSDYHLKSFVRFQLGETS